MTVTDHDGPHLTDQQRATADLARGDADLVLEIAAIADEQIGETESERLLRLRFEEALRSLRWDLGAPLSDHVVSADRVLRNPKGDVDEQRVCEFISRVLDGASAAEARHVMDRNAKSAKLAEARLGVAARLHGLASAQWGQPHAHEGSPVRRELPPAVGGELPPKEELPRREPGVAGAAVAAAQGYIDGSEHVEHVDEDPQWSTMQAAAIALEGEAKGELRPATVQRLRDEGFGKKTPAALPDFGQPAPVAFRATAIPQQRDQRPTERMPVIREAADEEPEPVVKTPFSEAGASGESSPSGSRARNGSGGEGSD